MITENKKWFVIITKPRAEKKVGKRLAEIGVENFVPLHKQLRQWHDRKKWVEVPLFGSYIFVKLEEKERNKVFDVVGVLRYLSISGKISILKDEELERIKTLCNFDGEIEISDTALEIGEKVMVMEGYFTGFIGTLISVANKDKIWIHFPDLNCFASVEIEKKFCKKHS